MTEYKVNDLLSVKLEWGSIMIYIANEPFEICKSIVLNIPLNEVRKFDEIESIDDIAENSVLYPETSEDNYEISPETELFAHFSNLKTWYDNGYNTCLLHSNLAFPLLKKLAEEGDILAKRAFKQEIAIRLESGSYNVIRYLINEGYFKHLSDDEIKILDWHALHKSFTFSIKKVFEQLEETDDEDEFDSRLNLVQSFFKILIEINKFQYYIQKIYKKLDRQTQCEFLAVFCFVKIKPQDFAPFFTIIREDSSSVANIVKKLVYLYENFFDFYGELNANLVRSSIGIRIILDFLFADIETESSVDIQDSIAEYLEDSNKEILKLELIRFIKRLDMSKLKAEIREREEFYAKKFKRSYDIEYTNERVYYKYEDFFYRTLKHLPQESLLEILLDHDLRIVENFLSLEYNKSYNFEFIERLLVMPMIDFVLKWILPEEAEALKQIGFNFNIKNGKEICDSPYIIIDETRHIKKMFPQLKMKDKYESFKGKLVKKEIFAVLRFRKAKKHILEILKNNSCKTVLDVCCGVGKLSKKISKRGFNVTGVDISKTMIDRAIKKKRAQKFLFQDASNMNLNADFDAAIIHLALHEMNSTIRGKVFNNTRRAVKEGGILIISDFSNNINRSIRARINGYFIIKGEEAFLEIYPDHYRNYKAFMNNGGINGFISSFKPETIISKKYFLGGHLGIIAIIKGNKRVIGDKIVSLWG